MQSKLKTNLDTGFLKLIAVITMVIDHIGYAFFPHAQFLRQIGRISFPLFCYCIVVGFLYTSDLKKYFLRMVIFAFVSQPFYFLAFYRTKPYEFFESPNIFFTLLTGLAALWCVREKKYILLVPVMAAAYFLPLDYSIFAIAYMLVLYLLRSKPQWGLPAFGAVAALYAASGLPEIRLFALLAAPLIFIPMKTGIRVNKWFFYLFYPAHLAVIALLRLIF